MSAVFCHIKSEKLNTFILIIIKEIKIEQKTYHFILIKEKGKEWEIFSGNTQEIKINLIS